MKKLSASLCLALAALTLCAELRLAEGGKTKYTIIYQKSGDVLLDPAVKDLADTLKEITGATFPVKAEADGPKIFIGKRAPGDTAEFKSRERRIKSAGNDLYIYGDYRFGTSAAIYNFLYYFCGCRWYTATGDKRIPKNPELKFDAIDYKHVPSFKSIEHGAKHAPAANNRGIRAWTRRNNAFMMPNYAFGAPDDGWTYIGPVTHTLAAYIPPIKRKPRTFNDDKSFFAGPHPCLADKEYFKTNPEYFSLDINGKRVHTKQVCFSNPKVRKLLLENVEKVIKAEKYDPNQYAVLDFTQNDRAGGFCFCRNCRKLEKKYQTPGGAYFDFLVELGNHFIHKYPKLMIRFFSYQEDMTGIPPTGITFPENLSVIIAPLRQDFSKPLSHKYNVHFLNQMKIWGKLCKEIWFWNYPTLYTHGMAFYSLFPGVYRNTENLRHAYDAGVRYIIAEQGGSLEHGYSFKELNVYLQNRMAEDINVDVDATLREFCDAVYGAASQDIQKYLKETDELCKKEPGFFRYPYDPRVMRRVLHTPANLIRWQHDFDGMERKVADNKHALFNVRRARINLDSITLLCYPECAKFDAKFAAELPIDKLFKRYCDRLNEDARVQYLTYPNGKNIYKNFPRYMINSARMAYEFNRRKMSYPAALVKKYGKDNLASVLPGQIRREPDQWNEDAAGGYSVRIPLRPKTAIVVQQISMGAKNGLPWHLNESDPFDGTVFTPAAIKRIRADKSKYHLVYLGRKKLTESGRIQLATTPKVKGNPGRSARFFLGSFWSERNPKQQFDFYLSVKDGGDDTLLVDRLVVAKVRPGVPAPEKK